MKKRRFAKALCGAVCAFLAVSMAVSPLLSTAYAAADTHASSPRTSRSGNVVTEYENEDDHQRKTIIWTKGITPPKMGGKDSQFQRVETTAGGKVTYIDYIAPFGTGSGWYDVNKSAGFEANDMNLCFAAAASNSLHWWMDQNASQIDQYLKMHPEDSQIQKLRTLRNSFESQQKSGVYQIFLSQFAGKKEGYWPDLLQDQFLNGYYFPDKGTGTNDSPAAEEKLQTKGPDPHGGFFYKVFGISRNTQRRDYGGSYSDISRDLRGLLTGGSIVQMTYSMGSAKTHVVTLWGAEYGPDGFLSAVYCTDSDDQSSNGMVRLRVRNQGGKAILTNHVDGMGSSRIEYLNVLSLGTKAWETHLQGPKTTLELVWSDTDLVYSGAPQHPTVSAANIAPGDALTLSVEGAQTNAGVYTARAILSGPAADKYQLPEDATHRFEIRKAPAPDIQFPTASSLVYGQTLADSTLTGGSEVFGSFRWQDPQTVPHVTDPGHYVVFTPWDSAAQNYEFSGELTQPIAVPVTKRELTVIAEDQLHVMQGDALPQLTYRTEGLVEGDRFSIPDIFTTATNTNTPGSYPILIRGGSLTNAENYTVSYRNGTLTILERELPPVTPPEPAPTEPELPEPPVQPETPTDPVTPTVPAEPARPTEPEKPAEPAKPARPEKPAGPEASHKEPSQGITPTVPEETVPVPQATVPQESSAATAPTVQPESKPAETAAPEKEPPVQSNSPVPVIVTVAVLVLAAAALIAAVIFKFRRSR